MPIFRYIEFHLDINLLSLQEACKDSWLIYPTQKSCHDAQKSYQQNWQPHGCQFMSIDDFMRSMIWSDSIPLMDEKRLVCLFQAMTAEDRDFFHIEKYPDLIDWGQHFFTFMEELADECIAAAEPLRKLELNLLDHQPWQKENYTRMLSIRSQYQEFISAKGFGDDIFDRDIAHLHIPAGVTRYVFVNQYYYSGLEKAVIRALEESGKQVVIYFQGKSEWYDEPALKARDFSLQSLFSASGLPFNLTILESPNLWQMAMRFLADYSVPQLRDDVPEQQPRHFVIDSQFHTQPYRKAFYERHFSFSSPAMFFKTRLGSFLQALGKGLEAMLSINGKKFVKLDWLLQAIAIPGFITYFQPSGSDLQRDNLIGWLCHLAEQNVLYLDFELNIASFPSCKPQQADSEAPLKDLFALLEQIDSITSISDLIAILDSPSGIRVGSLITEQESNCSDLSRCFYEAVANFYALEELKLVENWQALYPETSLAAGIFDLFLHFLKPRTYNLYRFVPEGNKAIITNLMDTRNLRAEQITFLNLVEGELPSRRTPVWLFNDKQNQHFGLKTWDDLRRWERYYFFRLLSAAKDVLLYTINNQGKNIEPSSFLAELYLFARENPGSGVTWTTDTLSAKTLLTHWVKSSPLHTLAQPAGIPAQNPPAFFHLPFQPERDFPHHNQIKLSWSSCERFIRNSFGFYLRDVAKLKERQTRIEETLNRKMFGILLHQYLMKITTRLAEQHQGILSMKWEWINHQFLRENLSSTLTHPLLTYQLPQNYNADYLTAFLSPFLIETAYWFFRTELAGDVDFTGEIITLIPETGDMTDLESQYKILPLPPLVENVLPDSSGNLPPVQNDKSCSMFQIKIRGIADLRLETPPKRFIIDFKTGDSDLLQLLFYMWFYYLIDQPDLAGKVRAGIYKLMDKQLHWLDYKQIQNPEKLPQAILQALIDISSEGYKPAADAKQKRYFASVSRSDLIPKMPTEEEEE